MDEEAKELARALLNSGEAQYAETFNVRRTGDQILVIAVKVGSGEKAIERLSEVAKKGL